MSEEPMTQEIHTPVVEIHADKVILSSDAQRNRNMAPDMLANTNIFPETVDQRITKARDILFDQSIKDNDPRIDEALADIDGVFRKMEQKKWIDHTLVNEEVDGVLRQSLKNMKSSTARKQADKLAAAALAGNRGDIVNKALVFVEADAAVRVDAGKPGGDEWVGACRTSLVVGFRGMSLLLGENTLREIKELKSVDTRIKDLSDAGQPIPPDLADKKREFILKGTADKYRRYGWLGEKLGIDPVRIVNDEYVKKQSPNQQNQAPTNPQAQRNPNQGPQPNAHAQNGPERKVPTAEQIVEEQKKILLNTSRDSTGREVEEAVAALQQRLNVFIGNGKLRPAHVKEVLADAIKDAKDEAEARKNITKARDRIVKDIMQDAGLQSLDDNGRKAVKQLIEAGVIGFEMLIEKGTLDDYDTLQTVARKAARGGRQPGPGFLDNVRQVEADRRRYGFLADAVGFDYRNEMKGAFPKEPEEQYKKVMSMIGKLEDAPSLRPVVKHFPNENIVTDVRELQAIHDALVLCAPEIGAEGKGRLNLLDSYYVMVNASNLRGLKQADYLKDVYGESGRADYALKPEDIGILARSEFLRVNEAYKVYRHALVNGVDIPKPGSTNGETIKVDITKKDLPSETRNRAYATLCEYIYTAENQKAQNLRNQIANGNTSNVGETQIELDKTGKMLRRMSSEITELRSNYDEGKIYNVSSDHVLAKSLQLAERVAEVIQRKALLDRKGNGKELIWGLVNLPEYRVKSGNIGPEVTLPYLPDMGISSFDMEVVKKYDNLGKPLQNPQYLLYPNIDPGSLAKDPRMPAQAVEAARHSRVHGADISGRILDIEDLNSIDWNACAPNAWHEYIKKVAKAIEIREHFVKAKWKSTEASADMMEGFYSTVEEFLPGDPYHFKLFWAYGVWKGSIRPADRSIDPKDAGWDIAARTDFLIFLGGQGGKGDKLHLTPEERAWFDKNK